jgi:hypothetical protein
VLFKRLLLQIAHSMFGMIVGPLIGITLVEAIFPNVGTKVRIFIADVY